jgi:hypothetical protein
MWTAFGPWPTMTGLRLSPMALRVARRSDSGRRRPEEVPEAFESTEQSLDLIALLVKCGIMIPPVQPMDFGGATGIMPRSKPPT